MGEPSWPQGQGFMAATSWQRAGNSACRAAREMVMRPLSSGSRSASRAARGYSGSSSRNRMPWCASEISPGRGGEPPPTSATGDALWCGARSTRWPQRSAWNWPARLSTAADSSAWVSSSGGSRPTSRCASIDLPVPGGPTSSTLCPPAAATSSARLAMAWPLTSRRSGKAGAGRDAGVCGTGRGCACSGGCSACTTSSRWVALRRRRPRTRAASAALAWGSTSQRG